MPSFLVDEDMPRSTAVALRQAGYTAVDVRAVGLRGHSDQDVFAYAQSQGAGLVTADKDLSNLLHYPLGTHAGIAVVRVPDELPTQIVNGELLHALAAVDPADSHGALIIVELGQIRLRKAGTPTS